MIRRDEKMALLALVVLVPLLLMAAVPRQNPWQFNSGQTSLGGKDSSGNWIIKHDQSTKATTIYGPLYANQNAHVTGTITADSAAFGAELTVNGNAAIETVNGPTITFSRSDTNVGEGEILGDISFYSDDTSVGFAGVRALIRAINTGSSGGQTNIDFYNSSGPASNLARTLRLDHAGNGIFENAVVVGVGSAVSGAELTVNGDGVVQGGASNPYMKIIDNTSGYNPSLHLFSGSTNNWKLMHVGSSSNVFQLQYNDSMMMQVDTAGNIYGINNISGLSFTDRTEMVATKGIGSATKTALEMIATLKPGRIRSDGSVEIDKDKLDPEFVKIRKIPVRDIVLVDKETGKNLCSPIRVHSSTTTIQGLLKSGDLREEDIPKDCKLTDIFIEYTDYLIEQKERDVTKFISATAQAVTELEIRESENYKNITLENAVLRAAVDELKKQVAHLQKHAVQVSDE